MMKTATQTKALRETLKYKESELTKCLSALSACLNLYNHQWNTGASDVILVPMEQAIQTLRTRDSELRSIISTLRKDLSELN